LWNAASTFSRTPVTEISAIRFDRGAHHMRACCRLSRELPSGVRKVAAGMRNNPHIIQRRRSDAAISQRTPWSRDTPQPSARAAAAATTAAWERWIPALPRLSMRRRSKRPGCAADRTDDEASVTASDGLFSYRDSSTPMPGAAKATFPQFGRPVTHCQTRSGKSLANKGKARNTGFVEEPLGST